MSNNLALESLLQYYLELYQALQEPIRPDAWYGIEENYDCLENEK